MPCRSDYMEPNAKERESKLVATLIEYVLSSLGQPVPAEIAETAKAEYGSVQNLDADTAYLRGLLSKLSEVEQDRILYDGRKASARRLADWWENHQEVDRKRLSAEAEAKQREAVLAKLSPEDRRLLGFN